MSEAEKARAANRALDTLSLEALGALPDDELPRLEGLLDHWHQLAERERRLRAKARAGA